jgi:hypothetical protein
VYCDDVAGGATTEEVEPPGRPMLHVVARAAVVVAAETLVAAVRRPAPARSGPISISHSSDQTTASRTT